MPKGKRIGVCGTLISDFDKIMMGSESESKQNITSKLLAELPERVIEELIINKYQAVTIENALRLAMNVLESRNKETETAMDRELLRADKYIKEVLAKSKF
jgi:translation initiation factor 2B subunit (eIF-2B alpha/beta/delta family)